MYPDNIAPNKNYLFTHCYKISYYCLIIHTIFKPKSPKSLLIIPPLLLSINGYFFGSSSHSFFVSFSSYPTPILAVPGFRGWVVCVRSRTIALLPLWRSLYVSLTAKPSRQQCENSVLQQCGGQLSLKTECMEVPDGMMRTKTQAVAMRMERRWALRSTGDPRNT